MPWRRGEEVIVSANGTEDRGFESRRGVRYLKLFILQCCSLYLICTVIVRIRVK
jgi:hypothetical protein